MLHERLYKMADINIFHVKSTELSKELVKDIGPHILFEVLIRAIWWGMSREEPVPDP